MININEILILAEAKIRDALAIIDKGAMQIALVTDQQGKLLGTLTDGDIRRALLRHLSLDTPVHKVMNATPKTAGRDWSERRILAVMEQYQVLQLPIVDGDQKIVGLANLHDLLSRHRHDNPVFLMAGGFGTRLRPLTNNCPKPMLKIGDKPILEQILQSFVDAGFYRFYISTHYKPEVIRDHFGNGEKWGVSIEYIHENEPLGTGGALGLLPHDEIDHPLFLMNGDLLTSLNLHSFLEFHESHGSVATMCVRKYEHQVPYGVITSEGIRIKSMVEKPVHKFFVNAGIYLLNPELVRSVEHGTRVDMPTLLEQQIGSGNAVNMFPIHEYWLDIGQIEEYKRANKEFGEVF